MKQAKGLFLGQSRAGPGCGGCYWGADWGLRWCSGGLFGAVLGPSGACRGLVCPKRRLKQQDRLRTGSALAASPEPVSARFLLLRPFRPSQLSESLFPVPLRWDAAYRYNLLYRNCRIKWPL